MVTKEEIAGPALRFKRNPKILQLLKPFSAVPSDVQHYETFGVHEFGEWSKIQWMVENLFHIGWLLIVWGPSGTGKTAWLIDLMLSIYLWQGVEWATGNQCGCPLLCIGGSARLSQPCAGRI